MVRTIPITLEEAKYNELKSIKDELEQNKGQKISWESFFLDAVKVSETIRKGVN